MSLSLRDLGSQTIGLVARTTGTYLATNIVPSLTMAAISYYVATRKPRAIMRALETVVIQGSQESQARSSADQPRRNWKGVIKIPGIVDVTSPEVIDLLQRGILTDMTQEAANNAYQEVIFDTTFVEKVEKILNRSTGNRVLLTGSSQSGKTTFIQNLVLRILKGEARGTLSHTEGRGEDRLGRRVFQLNKIDRTALKILSQHMCDTSILVVDEAHGYFIPEMRVTQINIPDMNCGLSIELKDRTNIRRALGSLPPILAATNEPFSIQLDPALNNRFTTLNIPARSGKSNQVSLEKKMDGIIEDYKLLYKQLDSFVIDKEAIAPLIYLIPNFAQEGGPNASVNFLNSVVEAACIEAVEEGRTSIHITQDNILAQLSSECGRTINFLKQKLERQQDDAEGFPIPHELVDCMKDMTIDHDKFDTLAVGRQRELEKVVQTLMSGGTNNLVIGGPGGVGKTCLIETLAYRLYLARTKGERSAAEQELISQVNIPKELINARIFELDLTKLISKTDAGRLIKVLTEAIKETGLDVVLFIDEFHTLLSDEQKNLLEALKTKITSNVSGKAGRLTLIGASNMGATIMSQFKDEALARRFQHIELSEPNSQEMLKIAERNYPDTVISKDVREAIYRLKTKLRTRFANPDATLAVLKDLRAWCRCRWSKMGVEAKQIDMDLLKEYLTEHYTESWEEYWQPLLSSQTCTKTVVVDKRLSLLEWVSFKVSSLFSRIFYGEWSRWPTESTQQDILVPSWEPRSNDQKAVSPFRMKRGEIANRAMQAAQDFGSGPVGAMLRLAGLDSSKIVGQIAGAIDGV